MLVRNEPAIKRGLLGPTHRSFSEDAGTEPQYAVPILQGCGLDNPMPA